MRLNLLTSLIGVGLIFMTTACGDDNKPSDPSPGDDGVVGAAGGTIESSDGRVAVVFGAGALSGDVTVAVVAMTAAEIAAEYPGQDMMTAYRMTPADLVLNEPIEVSVNLDAVVDNPDGSTPIPSLAMITATSTAARRGETFDQVEASIDITLSDGSMVMTGDVVDWGDNIGVYVVTATHALWARVEAQESAALGRTFHVNVSGGSSGLTGDVFFNHVSTGGSVEYEGQLTHQVGTIGAFTEQVGPYRCVEEEETNVSFNLRFVPDPPAAGFSSAAAVVHAVTECECYFDDEEEDEEYDDESDHDGPEGIRRSRGPRRGRRSRLGSDLPYLITVGADGSSMINASNGALFRQITGGNFFGAASLSRPENISGSPFQQFGVASFGPDGLLVTFWDPDNDEFGWSQLSFGHFTDATSIDGADDAFGLTLTNFSMGTVYTLEYNDDGDAVTTRNLANGVMSGSPISGIARSSTGDPDQEDFLVATIRGGGVGELYLANSTAATSRVVADLGLEPRRVRLHGNFFAVSNFESDELSLGFWDPAGTVTMLAPVTVGDGPVGIDIRETATGNYAVVSTGFNDNTYTLTVVSPAGDLVSNVTAPVPSSCSGPAHAVFTEGTELSIVVSCNTSNRIVKFRAP